MNKKTSLYILPLLIVVMACAFFAQPLQESGDQATPAKQAQQAAEPTNLKPTATPSENKQICEVKIVIRGIDEIDLGDGSKTVFVRIELENTGAFWAMLKGPGDDNDTATQKSVFITAKDGSTYGFIGRYEGGLPPQVLPDNNPTLYEQRGAVVTAFIPPGFSIRGQTMAGIPHDYGFAFQMPSSQVPDTITIKNMTLICRYPDATPPIANLAETYDLADVNDIQALPSTDEYTELIGSKIETDIEGQSIEFTAVTRNANTVNIFFNYINLSTSEAYPNLSGHIIGESGLASCQANIEADCAYSIGSFGSVQPGQTAEGLVASYTVPETETNLMLVYMDDDIGILDRVYRIGDTLDAWCENDYFPVIKGAQWIYRITSRSSNSTDAVDYAIFEIAEVFPDGFNYFSDISLTEVFSPLTQTSYKKGTCSSEGVILTHPTGFPVLRDMPAGSTWKMAPGSDHEVVLTSWGTETVTLPFGTFDAVKISGQLNRNSAYFSFYWYANGIGLVKASEGNSENKYERITELLSFTIQQ